MNTKYGTALAWLSSIYTQFFVMLCSKLDFIINVSNIFPHIWLLSLSPCEAPLILSTLPSGTSFSISSYSKRPCKKAVTTSICSRFQLFGLAIANNRLIDILSTTSAFISLFCKNHQATSLTLYLCMSPFGLYLILKIDYFNFNFNFIFVSNWFLIGE